MKKIFIGLILLSSVSVSANCSDGSAECYLGTYEGVRELGVHAFVSDQKCHIEITQSPYEDNDISFNYKFIESTTRKKTHNINGTVSSYSQELIYYSKSITDYRTNGTKVRDHYISRIELESSLSKDPKRNKYYLQLKLDEELKLVGVSVKQMRYSSISKLMSLALFGGWITKRDSCTNLVKID
jgi:hypothetical protein